jgi:hypothetical protein
MTSKWRRFEVLLPLQFNDGSEISGESLPEALLEVVDNFGAASYETQKSRTKNATPRNQRNQFLCTKSARTDLSRLGRLPFSDSNEKSE